MVDVVTHAGISETGILRNVTEGGFDLEIALKKKGQDPEVKILPYNYEDVKSVKVKISFK